MAKESIFVKFKKDIIEYSILFFFMLILNKAKIVNTINPFGFSFLFAMLYLEKNVLVLAVEYFISFMLFNISIEGLVIAVSTISFLVLLFLIFKLLKKKINFISTLIFSLLSQSGFVYYNIFSMSQIFTTLACLVVGLLFLYVCIEAFGAVFYRGIQSRFTLDESICFSLFIIALSSGIQGIYFFNLNLTTIVVLLALLICSRTLTKLTTIYFATLLGLGMSIANAGMTSLAVFVLYAVICTTLSEKHKCVELLGIVAVDVMLGLFLNAYAHYGYMNLISLAIIGTIFLCLPQKVFDKIKGMSYSYDGNLTNEFIVSGQRELLKQRLTKLGELFKQMQLSYRNLSVGEIDRQGACAVLTEELIKNHCKSCPHYNSCLENKKIREAINQLYVFGMEKGKVTIIDANNYITTSCASLSSMIGEINQTIVNYFEYEKTVKNQDNGKMLIAEQMGGTSEILNELSNNMVAGENINQKYSRELLDELTINRVVVNEVVVLDGEYGVERVIMVVRNSDVLSSAIGESLRSVFRLEFINIVRKMTRHAGWSILCYIPAPKYSLSVGFASSAKSSNAISGDTYSCLKISETKMLFALADGMGHGARANEISTIALSLVESFYKSGFSSQTIISSVNKILLPSGEENFTTLDVCVVDISNGTADFVKIGATASVVKSRENSSLIMTDSLPLGIVGGIMPKAQKKVLKSGDIIVIASDGVTDCFDDLEDYLSYVNNERVINVQMLADNILEEVQSREKEYIDDKTIITIKLNQFSKTN